MSKPVRYIAVSDTHGDQLDPDAAHAFFAFLKDWKPTHRLHLGDAFDFRCFRRKASDEEQRDGLREDVEAGCAFLRKFQPTVFLRGNHDERLQDMIASDDKRMSGLCGMLADEIADAHGEACQVLPYHKRLGVYTLGASRRFIHGFGHGLYAARQAALVYGDVSMGHGHAVDSIPIPGVAPRVGRMIGCLCRLDMSYNRAHLNALRHEHGWEYGLVHDDGTVTSWQARRTGKSWHLPTEVRTYA